MAERDEPSGLQDHQPLQKRTDRILEKMDKEGVSDKKLRKAVSKIKEESLPKLDERNSYSKTDPDATFMHMKEDAMNNGQTRLQYCRMPQ